MIMTLLIKTVIQNCDKRRLKKIRTGLAYDMDMHELELLAPILKSMAMARSFSGVYM